MTKSDAKNPRARCPRTLNRTRGRWAFLALILTLVTGEANGTVPETPEVLLVWQGGIFGASIGAAGLFVADIDADSEPEVVAAGGEGLSTSNIHWYVLGYDGVRYQHEWISPRYDGFVDQIKSAQLDGDEALEILIAVDGLLQVFDGKTLRVEAEYSTPADGAGGLAIANLDGDPALEAVVCNFSGVWVYDLSSGEQQLDLPGLGCEDAAVGETDGTAGLEIIIANFNEGHVLDGETGAVEWDHPLGFGHQLAIADFDGDDLDEIAVGNFLGDIQVWHGDTRALFWDLSLSDLDAIFAADVEGDGSIELIYGDGQHGRLHILNGVTGAEKWSVDNPAIGVTAITAGDSDGDEVNEILFSAGAGTSENFNLFVVDSASQDIEWESVYFAGPFYGFAHGDIDGDSQPEIIYGSFGVEWTINSGLFFVRDAVSKTLENQSVPLEENCARWKIQVANVDGDPAFEIFASCYGRLLCMDGATLAVQWQQELPFGLRYEGMEIGDPDDDGDLEIVASVGAYSSGVPGIYVDVFDASTGNMEWRSPDLESYFGDFAKLRLLRIADIDDDSVGELLVAERFGGLQALDSEANSIQLSTSGIHVTALDTADLDDNGIPEVIVGNTGGEIQTIHPVTGAATTILGPYGGEIDGLVVKQMFGSEALDYVFAVSDRLYLVDGESGDTYWTSDDLGDQVGENDSIRVDDFDGDGVNEIWVNGGYFNHLIFEIENILMKSSFETILD